MHTTLTRPASGENQTPLSSTPPPRTDAKAFEERAITTLKEAGFRITMPRVLVMRALADASRALSAYAIREKILTAGGKIDVVSVYRILRTFQECDLIHHVATTDGYVLRRMDGPVILLVDADGNVTEALMSADVQEAVLANLRAEGVTTVSPQLRIEVVI